MFKGIINGIKFLVKASIVICTIIGVIGIVIGIVTDNYNESITSCAVYGFVGILLWRAYVKNKNTPKHHISWHLSPECERKILETEIHYDNERARIKQEEQIRAMKRQMEENNLRMKNLAKDRDYYQSEVDRYKRGY